MQAVGLGLILYGGDLANPRLAYPDNAPGEFFVDRRCIDCDNCRSLAPQIFVQRLPTDDGDDGYAYFSASR